MSSRGTWDTTKLAVVCPSQYSWLHMFLNNKLFCDFHKVGVREIGLLSFPICSIYVVNFGKRTDVSHFQISGIDPVINDVFKTKQTSYTSSTANSRKTQFGISSGPPTLKATTAMSHLKHYPSEIIVKASRKSQQTKSSSRISTKDMSTILSL